MDRVGGVVELGNVDGRGPTPRTPTRPHRVPVHRSCRLPAIHRRSTAPACDCPTSPRTAVLDDRATHVPVSMTVAIAIGTMVVADQGSAPSTFVTSPERSPSIVRPDHSIRDTAEVGVARMTESRPAHANRRTVAEFCGRPFCAEAE